MYSGNDNSITSHGLKISEMVHLTLQYWKINFREILMEKKKSNDQIAVFKSELQGITGT